MISTCNKKTCANCAGIWLVLKTHEKVHTRLMN